MKPIRPFVLVTMSAVLLTGCGAGMGGCNGGSQSEVQSANGGIATVDAGQEPVTTGEGPQYTQPTMENLKGKRQLYPSRYVCKQYPNSRVIMALVKPNLRPGSHNCVLLGTIDEKPVISNYYRQELAQKGYTPTYNYDNPAFHRSVWKKGDVEVEVRVSPDPYGNQTIQILSGPYTNPYVYTSKGSSTTPPWSQPVRKN